MTRDEAIDIVKWLAWHTNTRPSEEDVEQAIEALKQEPKTVLYSGDGYADGYMVYDMAECPNCGYEYEDGDKDWGLSFCPNCGQKLNWESEERDAERQMDFEQEEEEDDEG